MKIIELTTTRVNLPLDKPITTAIHCIDSVGCVLVELKSDQGLTGESFVFTINATRLKAFDEMIRGFDHHVIGNDPHYVNAIWQNIWNDINPTGHKGVTVAALSAIDTACWDLIGKAADTPLHHLFGVCRDRIPTYASGGLWLSQDIDSLVSEARSFLDQGFKAMKIRVGSGDNAHDLERVKAVREAVGDQTTLLADANQALRPKQAIRLARELENFEVEWLEEPVSAGDLRGHSQVTQAVNIDIASGETEYTRFGLHAMMERRACDVVMPDLQRVGGLSEMRRVAALASAYHLPISTHIFTEYSLCIAGSEPNCISVEHMPWYAKLFNETLQLDNGNLIIPDRPGTGFTFNQQAIKTFLMA